MDDERAYVRAVFELMGGISERLQEALREYGPGERMDTVVKETQRTFMEGFSAMRPPGALEAFHAEYLAHCREIMELPMQRTETSGRLLMPEGQYQRQERGMELLRVLMAVATDEDVAAGGLPPESRWQFVVGDERDQTGEQLVMVDKEGPDWREKLRAELERRGMPERDIAEVMRRLEGLGDGGGPPGGRLGGPDS